MLDIYKANFKEDAFAYTDIFDVILPKSTSLFRQWSTSFTIDQKTVKPDERKALLDGFHFNSHTSRFHDSIDSAKGELIRSCWVYFFSIPVAENNTVQSLMHLEYWSTRHGFWSVVMKTEL